MSTRTPLLVVMGVSGSGKTTVGELLADRLGVPFADADNLHPEANIAKMAAGHPLTDDDRWPWLERVGTVLAAARSTGMVMACSALKRSYRAAILAEEPVARFIDLEGSHALLESRVDHRVGHFMPPSLLDSQLATLEPLGADEPGFELQLDAHSTPADLVDAALDRLATIPIARATATHAPTHD
jgi:gluconokinase